MTDKGWILTADQKPESKKWVVAVFADSLPGEWIQLKCDARYADQWYGTDGRAMNTPIKWRYPWTEPQEDTAESLNLELIDLLARCREVHNWRCPEDTPNTISAECDALDERARAIGIKMFVRLSLMAEKDLSNET